MMDNDFVNLRYRACAELSVSLMGPPRFITKRIGLARFVGVNPRKRFGLWLGLFFGSLSMIPTGDPLQVGKKASFLF